MEYQIICSEISYFISVKIVLLYMGCSQADGVPKQYGFAATWRHNA